MFSAKHSLHFFTVTAVTVYNYYIMRNSKSLGNRGEQEACKFLEREGYRIIRQNYRKPWGEIDIVAREQDKTLVFIEVKTLRVRSESGLLPEDNLTKAKMGKLRRACDAFVVLGAELVTERAGWRIDLIAVSVPVDHDGNEKPKEVWAIKHYKNI